MQPAIDVHRGATKPSFNPIPSEKLVVFRACILLTDTHGCSYVHSDGSRRYPMYPWIPPVGLHQVCMRKEGASEASSLLVVHIWWTWPSILFIRTRVEYCWSFALIQNSEMLPLGYHSHYHFGSYIMCCIISRVD